jgi:hypothetical protein
MFTLITTFVNGNFNNDVVIRPNVILKIRLGKSCFQPDSNSDQRLNLTSLFALFVFLICSLKNQCF